MALAYDPEHGDKVAADRTPHPRIVRMIEHWRSLSPGPGLLPGRRLFDPLHVPDLLPNLWLVDVVRGTPNRYRYRLVGSALHEAGAPMRVGMFIDEMGDLTDQVAAHASYDGVVSSREPEWRRGKPILKHLQFIAELERVKLPLAEDGRNVDMILCMTIFYLMDGKIR
jgi:hypothetical protein